MSAGGTGGSTANVVALATATSEPAIETAGSPIVRLEGISKRYEAGGPLALAETDLDIRPGEFFSLLGPSGSGKTTTLRLIAGFEAPNTGRIFLSGADVTRLPANHRDVNTVFQNYALFPHLSVEQNVAYPLDVKGVGKPERVERVAAAIALVEMSGFESRLPHELSGGQRQRIALARALIGRPKVLLLDEPLGALDLRLRQQMQSVLTRLQREVGITFVYVTHDHGEALSMSDRMAVMSQGRIQQIDTPQQIYYQPKNRFVAGFIGNTNLIDGIVEPGGKVFTNGDLRLDLLRPAPSGPATISIRFENLEIVDSRGGAVEGSSFEAVVERTTFQGDGVDVGLRIGSTRLTACIHGRSALRHAQGNRATVAVDSESIVVLRD